MTHLKMKTLRDVAEGELSPENIREFQEARHCPCCLEKMIDLMKTKRQFIVVYKNFFGVNCPDEDGLEDIIRMKTFGKEDAAFELHLKTCPWCTLRVREIMENLEALEIHESKKGMR
jgi:hypothetical protein